MSVRIDAGVCVVRSWRPGDESIRVHADDVEVWRQVRDVFPRPYTERAAADWVVFAREQPRNIFCLEVHGEPAGGIGLELGSDVNRVSAELGYWLGRKFWGKGIATAAARAVTEYGFGAFELTRVFAVPFADNKGSVRVLEKAGFVVEGVMKRAAIKEGRVRDQLLFARYR